MKNAVKVPQKIYFLHWWLELRVYVGGGKGGGVPGGGGFEWFLG